MAGDRGEGARARELYEIGREELAAQFDPERELVRHDTDEGLYYTPRGTLTYARCLLLDGDAAERTLAARMIERVLASQERQPGNIHEGNFPWMVEDGHVTDLNAVEFVLEQLCHILLESEGRLPAPTRAAILAALRLGLAEVARLDVDIAYTNICLLDIHNSVLGGQLLGAPGWRERGERKLARWAAYTAASGAPREYNSPTYCGVDLTALAALAEHAADPAARLLARLLEERIWLHVAAHYHTPTTQLAGPHSRAYQRDVTGGRGFLKVVLYKVLGDERLLERSPFYPYQQGEGYIDVARATYHCPRPVLALLAAKPLPFAVRETADATEGLDLSSALTADWALGAASRTYSEQSDNLLLHYRKAAEPGFGVVYTRFILNDKRIGSVYHASARSRSSNLNDEGDFRGLHHRNKALGVYGLRPQTADLASVRLDVFFPGRAGLGRVLVGNRPVGDLPLDLPAGAPLIVEDGAVYVGVLPLRHSNLGRAAPVRLEERDGDLVLSTVIYEGQPKRFWEYSSLGGPFYRGNIECGLALEVAARDEFPDAAAFAAHLAAARVEDVTADGVRTIRYRSGGDELLLRYRLADLGIVERRANVAALAPVPLASPLAVQGRPLDGSGALRLGDARLAAPGDPEGQAASWLYLDPEGVEIVAARATAAAGPWELRLPGGRRLATDALGPARAAYRPDEGRLELECAGAVGDIALYGWPDRPMLVANGEEIGARLREVARGEWLLPAGSVPPLT